jgi:hypothetical protein
MKVQRSSTSTIERLDARGEPETRLHGRWLMLIRVAWLTIVVLALALFVASVPSYFVYLHGLAPQSVSDAGVQLSRHDLQTLQAVGLSIDFYAWYNVILNVLFVASFVLVGLLIFWRKSNDRVALLASFSLVLFSIDNMIVMLQTLPSSWGFVVQIINFLGGTSIYFFFYLFPSGHVDRRWIGWLIAGMIIFQIADVFLPWPSSSASFLALLYAACFLIFTTAMLVVQVYRYRRISSPIERQQTKWVVFGAVIGLTGYLIGVLVVFVLLNEVLHVGMLLFMLSYTVVDLFLLAFPLFIAIAILRSRLWDIDTIINKTLVYGLLTALLAAIYAGLVLGLQALLGGLIHQTNAIALVISTLAIYVLFQPFRGRIQAIIDRRFYRRKYDAARTLAAFSTILRTEVDLATLREHLVAVVQETMQPTSVSLWVRPPIPAGTHQAPWRSMPAGHAEEEARREER